MGLTTETVKQFIQEAINCIDKKSPKLSLSGWDNIEKYNACEEIILNYHQYKNKTVKQYFNDLKCSEKFVKYNILKPTLNTLKYDNKVTSEKFNQKISEYEAENVSREDKNWYHIFPVNFRLESKSGTQKEFEISENVVQLLDFDAFIKSEFWSNGVKEELNKGFYDNKNLSKYSFGITVGVGRDLIFARDQSVKILNRFLGAVNLSYWIYGPTKGYRFIRYPRTSGYTEIVTPSYVLQYDANKEFEDLHFEAGFAVGNFVVFSDITTNKYQRLIAIFESLNRLAKESEAYKVIFEALEIYNLALNKIGYDSGFLDLWTGLEKMTFKRRKGRHNDIPYSTIIKRIWGIKINPPEIIEIRLKDLLNKRHELVHGGSYNIISESDFEFLKWNYEMVFIFLMNHNNKFKTIDETELIYDKSGKTKEELEDEVRVINYLIEEKEMLHKNREDKKS